MLIQPAASYISGPLHQRSFTTASTLPVVVVGGLHVVVVGGSERVVDSGSGVVVSSGVVVNGVVSGVVGPVGHEQRAGKSTAFLPSHFMNKVVFHCKKNENQCENNK